MRTFRRTPTQLLAIGAVVLALTACGDDGESGDDATAGEDFPTRALTFVIPYAPGGSTDPMGREFATALEEKLGTSVIVENREGGGGTIGAGAIITSEPDGYTLGMADSGALTFQPLVNPDLPYKTTDDYDLVAKMGESLGSLIVVRDDAPWETFEDLVEDAQARPGEIRVSTPGANNVSDLQMQQINLQIDEAFRLVPFDGGGAEAMTALLGDRVEVNIGSASTLAGQIEAGAIRPLAITGPERAEDFFPDVPSAGELGYQSGLPITFNIVVPKGVPEAALTRLREVAFEIVSSDDFKTWMTDHNQLALPEDAEGASDDLQQIADDFEALHESMGG